MIREKCKKKGHKFRGYALLPMVFCARWRCDGQAVSMWCPPEIAPLLHNAIPWENRFPQVTLDKDGKPIVMDMRTSDESFCSDCPDHEACMQNWPCSEVKRIDKENQDG